MLWNDYRFKCSCPLCEKEKDKKTQKAEKVQYQYNNNKGKKGGKNNKNQMKKGRASNDKKKNSIGQKNSQANDSQTANLFNPYIIHKINKETP